MRGDRNFSLLLGTALYIAAALLPVPSVRSEPGDTTAGFLRLGAGARAAGMGEAFTAVAEGASAAYWNPAGLARIGRQEATFTHMEHVEGVRYGFLAWARPLKSHGGMALRAAYLTAGRIEGFDASGTPLGHVPGSYDLAVGASYGRGFSWGGNEPHNEPHRLLLGLGAQGIRHVVAGDSAAGPSFDAGLIYTPPDRRLPSFGASLQNWGPDMKFASRPAPLPRTARLGLAKSFDVLHSPLQLGLDGAFPGDANPYIAAGLEYSFAGLVAIRFGYRSSLDVAEGFSVGTGISGDNVSVDYALAPFGAFGYMHRMSVSIRFGRGRGLIPWESEAGRILGRAQGLYARGRLLDSYQEIQKVLGLMPLQEDARALRNRIESEYKVLEEGRRAALVSEHLRLSREALKRADLLAASSHLQLILSLDPGQEEARRELDSIRATFERLKMEEVAKTMAKARSRSARGDYAGAIESYGLVLSLYKGHREAQEGLRQVQAKLEDQMRDRRLAERRRRIANVYQKALRKYERGQDPEAFELLSAMLAEFPENPEAEALQSQVIFRYSRSLHQKGAAFLAAGRLEEAVEAFRKAVRVDPGNSQYGISLEESEKTLAAQRRTQGQQKNMEGFRAYESGNLERAIGLWKEALRLDPANEKFSGQISMVERELTMRGRQ